MSVIDVELVDEPREARPGEVWEVFADMAECRAEQAASNAVLDTLRAAGYALEGKGVVALRMSAAAACSFASLGLCRFEAWGYRRIAKHERNERG